MRLHIAQQTLPRHMLLHAQVWLCYLEMNDGGWKWTLLYPLGDVHNGPFRLSWWPFRVCTRMTLVWYDLGSRFKQMQSLKDCSVSLHDMLALSLMPVRRPMAHTPHIHPRAHYTVILNDSGRCSLTQVCNHFQHTFTPFIAYVFPEV